MSNNNSTEKKDKQIENLVNLVENHTRTQRHLEQYSHIGEPAYKDMAQDKQKIREKQINNLKDQILEKNNDKLSIKEQMENISENYSRSNEYLQNNFNNMSSEDINNITIKQKQRLNQLDTLSQKNSTNFK